MAGLYVVATPIGNLGDITFRAVEVLKSCHTLACEDTRHSRKLLTHLGISRPLLACHANNMDRCTPRILDLLREDRDVAYLSDAGTPGVSDPGSALVRGVRDAGFPVIPIPGPSAVTALISAGGIAGRGWYFEGFLPPKGQKRRTRLAELLGRGDPVVLYESPHRFKRLTEDLLEVAPGFHLVVGRELTKIHEQIVTGTVEEIRLMVDNNTILCRGEFVVVVWSGKCR
ncbi:MAG: 16S rRNA (cytidine(1402)-2'-O)-methyltransferase [Spirochaetaceae bacterium]|nr:MAG: 16S rRNA (cytidine(1402)-2'-O)-methyltransferase [Spirochaetaceae bacterium]